MDYRILAWQNENGLTNYPLTGEFEVSDFIVDASFIQFDNFIPVLTNTQISSVQILLTITYDKGSAVFTYDKTDYDAGVKFLRLFKNTRFLGTITFGSGCDNLWANYVGRNIASDLPFLPQTCTSIPSKDAVYSFDGLFGAVILSRLDTGSDQDKSVFFNKSLDRNSITFNAVKNHFLDGDFVALKKINLVSPINNNIFISSNDIIKFIPNNNEALTVSLVGDSTASNINIPTLTS